MIKSHRLIASPLAAVLVMTACLAASGCKFGKLTNRYMDCVDRKNDRCVLYLDSLYSPALDLNRVGHPDWCRSTPKCVARRTCMIREGARDVPEPSFVVYPQPPETELDTGYSAALPDDDDYELEGILPPSPSDGDSDFAQ